MAQTTSAETGGTGFGYWFDKLAGFYIEKERIRALDVETQDSDNNVPDSADMVNGTAQQAGSDSFGGAFTRSFAGLPVWGWGLITVGGLATLKITKVI